MGVPDADDRASLRLLEAVAARAEQQSGTENFPVALRLLPRAVRADLMAVYAFARFVDDVGDETGHGPEQRLDLLDVIDRDLHALDGAMPALGPVAALRPLVAGGRVPLEPFLDLVEANRVDQRVASYQSFDDLLGYCRLSAAPVGRVVLHLAGAASARNVADSDSVCAGLQVLEHCQDVGEDARAGRVYLPQTDLTGAGVEAADLRLPHTTPALRRATGRQVERSRELLRTGPPLVRRLSGWARFAVAGYVAGGLATADALEASGYDVLGRLVRPSRPRTAWHAVRVLVGRPRR